MSAVGLTTLSVGQNGKKHSSHQQPFCVFEPALGGLGATYDVHLRLIEKRIVDFLLVLTEVFAKCYG